MRCEFWILTFSASQCERLGKYKMRDVNLLGCTCDTPINAMRYMPWLTSEHCSLTCWVKSNLLPTPTVVVVKKKKKKKMYNSVAWKHLKDVWFKFAMIKKKKKRRQQKASYEKRRGRGEKGSRNKKKEKKKEWINDWLKELMIR